MTIEKSLQQLLELAYHDFLELEKSTKQQRNDAILAMAKGLTQAFEQILEANTLDLLEAKEMVRPELVINWLKLTPYRLENAVKIIEAIAKLNDPLDRRIYRLQQQYNLPQSYCRATSLGVILYVSEALPELGAIAAAMAIKTGNSIILRGTGESTHTKEAIAKILQSALVKGELPHHCIQDISPDLGNFMIKDLVTQDKYIQLIIPYGRPSLVRNVYNLATIPTLFTVMGNCYLHYCNSGDMDLVQKMIIDSHQSKPDPVNAIEKVTIEENYKSYGLIKIWKNLKEEGFQLKGDHELVAEFPEYLTPVQPEEWGLPYLSKTVAFKLVDNLEQGIEFINQHSTGHTNCLVTDSYEVSRNFGNQIKSAFTYINCSPRFSRISQNEEAVYLGIANQKDGRRGLISLESFTTIKQVIEGID
ncbi:MAG: gamma-glutamyl-phosphate reductase [Gloeocapsa sp. DLM2.Bin57]|nr:MAG: gamma-glutamyl-phosphate reductase [Gloeocapsa sp. DLM2.Bin57]